MTAPKKTTMRHRIEYLIYRGFEGIIKRLSLETTFKVGELIGRITYRFAKERKGKLLRNLRRAYGEEKTTAQLTELSAEIFERNGANFFSSLRVPFLNNEEILKHVEFSGLDHFLAAAKRGGIVLVVPHMGNWELLAQALFLTKDQIRVGTHYRPLNNTLINEIIKRRRKKRGLVLFAKQDSTLRLTNFVREGGVLGILADQRVGSRGAAGVFFGRPTTCSPLPHLVAKRGKGQLVALHCETIASCRWKISFDIIDEATAQACADTIEQAWRKSPADVFWFEDRWRLQGNKPLEFLSKYPENHGATRPLRMVCLGMPPVDLSLPGDLITIESDPVDLNSRDEDLKKTLIAISNRGRVPVDAFCCPASEAKRIKKLAGKILVISP
ncbi:MAG: hypothetical protein QNL68_14060 [Akkermansiaceae bacterium]|jgi:KDO2-lipid IV(A) lauroyltransferase